MSLLLSPSEKPEHPITPYTITGRTIGRPINLFCRGCGYGSIAQAFGRVFRDNDLDPEDYPLIVGVGCYSMMPIILPGQCLMTLHGRTLPVATGIKAANPKLKPICIAGDGDLLSIGTNHFVHTCRRNVDIVAVLLHNKVFGMTGGQAAPTTPTGMSATTAPYGFREPTIDGAEVAKACGATYIARWTTAHMRQFMKSLTKAINRKGFSYIEVVSQCVTYFGRKNKMPEPVECYRWIKGNSVPIAKAKDMSAKDLEGKWVVGEFLETERPELITELRKMAKSVRG